MTVSRMIVLAVMCLSHVAFAAVPISPRIVGGTNAAKGQFPYQVSVRDSRNFNNVNHLCGGVIVGYNEVLTAAHCVSDVPLQKLYIVAGTTTLSLATPGYVAISAAQVFVHEFYRVGSYGNDIALIRLANNLPLNRTDIRPISLLRDMPRDGSECTVSGWGDTNGTSYSPTISQDLRFARMSFISNTECKKRYPYVQTDGVCGTGINRVAGPCGNMDAGDPLACGGGLMGVYSWSESCIPGVPGVYTAVPFHLFWISEKMNQFTTTTTKPTPPLTRPTPPTPRPTPPPTRPTPSTTRPTTRPTLPTVRPTTRPTPPTTRPTTRPTPPTTKPTPPPTIGTTRRPGNPNRSCINAVNSVVVISALVFVISL